MASLGLLGGLAGLGQGISQAGTAMADQAKTEYLQSIRRAEKLEDRSYQEGLAEDQRKFQKELLGDQRSYQEGLTKEEREREEAQRVAKVEVKDGKQYSYNAAGKVIKEEPYKASDKRQYLDPATDAQAKLIRNKLDALYKQKEAMVGVEDTSAIDEQIREAERMHSQMVTGRAAKTNRDIISDTTDSVLYDNLFDGSGRGLLRSNVRSAGGAEGKEKSVAQGSRGAGSMPVEEKMFQQLRANPNNANYTDEQLRAAIRQKLTSR